MAVQATAIGRATSLSATSRECGCSTTARLATSLLLHSNTTARGVRAQSKRGPHVAVVELVREEEELDLVARLAIPIQHTLDDEPSTSQPSHAAPRRRAQLSPIRTSRHGPRNHPVKGSSWSKEADLRLDDKFIDDLLGAALRQSPKQDKAQPLKLPSDMDKYAQEKQAKKIARFYGALCARHQLAAALQLLHLLEKHDRQDVLPLLSHRSFMAAAARAKRPKEALRFLQTMPKQHLQRGTFNLAIASCYQAKDMDTCLHMMKLMEKQQMKPDLQHYTTAITVCRSSGSFQAAFRLFTEARNQGIKPDAQIYSALFAAAAATVRKDPEVAFSRKEQLVILERCLQLLEEAVDDHVTLNSHVWNSVIYVAACTKQLQRAFQLLDQMQSAGVSTDEHTYGSLIEACVLAKEPELAQRLFNNAMREGFTSSRQIYTAAINACMISGKQDLQVALDIYSIMQRNGCEPDAILYGNLITLAGKVGKLEYALQLFNDMQASGISLGRSTCSALIYACMHTNNPKAAVRIYETLRFQGIMPRSAQMHSLMEHFALEHNLGKVVELFAHMLENRMKPTTNTFRILITACQRAGQVELAFEVLSAMKARGLIPREANASKICYQLAKSCFNRLREAWITGGYPPNSSATMMQPAGTRTPEAQKLLDALRSRSHTARASTYLDNSDTINWANLASNTYKEFVSSGTRPDVRTLDKVLACLRLQLQPDHSSSDSGLPSGTGLLQDLAREQYNLSKETQTPEHRFDRRAVLLLEEAIAMELLPSFNLDYEELEVDLCSMPPTTVEVYVLALLNTMEQRINAPMRKHLPHITLLVPPFDPNFVNWPSDVDKIKVYYDEMMSSVDTTWEDDDLDSLWADARMSRNNVLSGHTSSGLSSSSIHLAEDEEHTALHSSAWALGSHEAFGILGDEAEEEVDSASGYGTSIFSSSGSRGQLEQRSGRSSRQQQQQQQQQQLQPPQQYTPPPEVPVFDKRSIIGLAAAAQLRRMKMFATMDWKAGRIMLEPREMVAWSENKRKSESLAVQQPEKLGALHSLGDQQRNIRLGLGVSGGSAGAGSNNGSSMPSPQPWVRRPSMPSL